MPVLSAIQVYPIKSLDGTSVSQCRVLPSGALENDRHLALFDQDGNLLNAKRHAGIHAIRADFDLTTSDVQLQAPQLQPATFHLADQLGQMAEWLSDFFGFHVRVQQDERQGFPDDTESPGPTVISNATLQTVAGWFPSKSTHDLRRRFRANLEFADCEPFWEDQLYSQESSLRFQVGEVQFWGVNPCQRCPVPTRDPDTGEPIPLFAKTFSELRQRTLPDWAPISRFDHFYRLAVNTRLASLSAGLLRVGDTVTRVD